MDKILRYESIEQDDITRAVSSTFDYDFSGVSECPIPTLEKLPTDFSIGLIVGPSGSGKSSMLRLFGEETEPSRT
jgi:ABC-type Fe3+/spermidine/putrescine transport system ATPase subunit